MGILVHIDLGGMGMKAKNRVVWETSRGQALNEQPDGSSMLWIRTTALRGHCDIRVQYGPYTTSATHWESDNILASEIPEGVLYATGSFPIYILSADRDPFDVGLFVVGPGKVPKKNRDFAAFSLLARLSNRMSGHFAQRLREIVSACSPYAKAKMVGPSLTESPFAVGMNRRILVADEHLPRQGSASDGRPTLQLLKDLVGFGYQVEFVATSTEDDPVCRAALEELGLTVAAVEDGFDDVTQYVNSSGSSFGIFCLIGAEATEKLLATARNVAPHARILIDAAGEDIKDTTEITGHVRFPNSLGNTEGDNEGGSPTTRFGAITRRAALLRILESAGALPLEIHVQHCQDSALSPMPLEDPSKAIDVSIIIPVHNEWKLTRTCLNSVALGCVSTGLNCEVILADDNSSDETANAAIHFPGLRIVRQAVNVGFLKNCNAAAGQARGRFLLFLNNDTVVMPNWLVALFATFENYPDAAIVGSKLLFPDGKIQEAGGLLYSDGSAENVGRGRPQDDLLWCFDREVDYVSGASILVPRPFWDEVGGFDERYAPAYAEDCDLAMAARRLGLCVVYSADSVVVHFEHGSGAQQPISPNRLMKINKKKLYLKWEKVLTTRHLENSGEWLTRTTHAERRPQRDSIVRRLGGHLNVLYVSIFPSHPDNHGIQNYLRKIQELGHRVHFVLISSASLDEASLSDMRLAWDSLDVIPYSFKPGSDNTVVPFDGWFDEQLGEEIRLLCQRNQIDVAFCNCVFLSKILECIPAHVLKLIDTHGRMDRLYGMPVDTNQLAEFYSCAPQEQSLYFQRADIVLTRRFEDAQYINQLTSRQTAMALVPTEVPRASKRTKGQLKTVGIHVKANHISVAILHDFIAEIGLRRGDDCPFVVEVLGQIGETVAGLTAEQQRRFKYPWVQIRESVPEISVFYAHLDVVVSLVTMGTGLNEDSLQAMASAIPVVGTRAGMTGLETDHPLHNHESVSEVVSSLLKFVEETNELNELAAAGKKRYEEFVRKSQEEFMSIFRHPKIAGFNFSSE